MSSFKWKRQNRTELRFQDCKRKLFLTYIKGPKEEIPCETCKVNLTFHVKLMTAQTNLVVTLVNSCNVAEKGKKTADERYVQVYPNITVCLGHGT